MRHLTEDFATASALPNETYLNFHHDFYPYRLVHIIDKYRYFQQRTIPVTNCLRQPVSKWLFSSFPAHEFAYL